MVRYRDTLWCDGCGVEIRWKPEIKDQLSYCCWKCLRGEVCHCAEVLEEYPTTSSKQPGMPIDLPLNKLADV
jgi:hypothetical protein